MNISSPKKTNRKSKKRKSDSHRKSGLSKKNIILKWTTDFVNFLKELNQITGGALLVLVTIYGKKSLDYLYDEFQINRKLAKISNEIDELKLIIDDKDSSELDKQEASEKIKDLNEGFKRLAHKGYTTKKYTDYKREMIKTDIEIVPISSAMEPLDISKMEQPPPPGTSDQHSHIRMHSRAASVPSSPYLGAIGTGPNNIGHLPSAHTTPSRATAHTIPSREARLQATAHNIISELGKFAKSVELSGTTASGSELTNLISNANIRLMNAVSGDNDFGKRKRKSANKRRRNKRRHGSKDRKRSRKI